MLPIPRSKRWQIVPPRPPGFCVGCPERPIFAAMKLVQRELGEHNISADIGCHLFSVPAAVQYRRHHDGLRSRSGVGFGLQRQGR